MKRFLDVCRLIFVSSEALSILIVLSGLHWWPEVYSRAGDILKSNGEALKYLITMPVAMLGGCITFSWNILFPVTDNSVLLEWEGYQRLMDRAYFSVALCVVCTAAAVSIWIFQSVVPSLWLTAAGLISWCIPLVTTITAYVAAHKIRALLERYRKTDRANVTK
jgi:hypothetical protein